MNSVWIVESGEYSNYGIDAIFDFEDKAAEFVKRGGGSSYREWPLNTWHEEKSKFNIKFNFSGDITDIRESAYVDEPVEVDAVELVRWYPDEIEVTVKRGPREKAIKIASERFIQIRAKFDEAHERLSKVDAFNQWITEKMNNSYCINYECGLAEILAGFEPIPEPDRCTDSISAWYRQALGLDAVAV